MYIVEYIYIYSSILWILYMYYVSIYYVYMYYGVYNFQKIEVVCVCINIYVSIININIIEYICSRILWNVYILEVCFKIF